MHINLSLDTFDIKNIYQLPYPENALEPGISARQIGQHYKGHLLVYYEKLLVLLKENNMEVQGNDLIALVKHCFGKQNLLPIFNCVGQIINHIYYFESFVKHEINKSVATNIKNLYNNMSILTDELISTAEKYGFGSSWIWIATDKNHDIKMFVTPNAFTAHNLDFVREVILCLDLWEHAYYIDHLGKRTEYIKQAIKLTNISQVFEN